MKESNYIWKKHAFLTHCVLYSNNKNSNYNLIFSGAENVDAKRWKVNFIFSFNNINGASYGTSIYFIVEPGDKLRFESNLGIIEKISVEYNDRDQRIYERFFSAKFIKFLKIEKDYIEYEVHCC